MRDESLLTDSLFHLQKPDNIGFDENDVVKLFDFGLAKELNESAKNSKGLYRMTGFTGAIRYMAPEVGLCKSYDTRADIYSWAILFWYILALEAPFNSLTPENFAQNVFENDTRPKLDPNWSKRIQQLLETSWDRRINNRPDAEGVIEILYEELMVVDPSNTKPIPVGSSGGSLRTTRTAGTTKA